MNPRSISIVLLMIAAAVGIVSGATTPASYSMGQQSLALEDASRGRHWAVEFWYPTHVEPVETAAASGAPQIFKAWTAVPNAPVAEGRFPLLVFSHGTGGNRFANVWLIERFVKAGYAVLSLDHYGNNSFHKIPREFLKWWERPIDIQFVLSELLQDPVVGRSIDASRIGGVGHSLGGYTNIALAGGQVDRLPPGMPTKLPPEFPETDEVIDYGSDSEISESFQKYAGQVKDDRFKAFFVMAPAIGFGFHAAEQVVAIDRPIYIVAGRGDRETPVTTNALNFHRIIPQSEIFLFDEPVGHYVFLNEATAFGKQVVPSICVDAEGVDRADVHAKTAELALTFFEQHLR